MHDMGHSMLQHMHIQCSSSVTGGLIQCIFRMVTTACRCLQASIDGQFESGIKTGLWVPASPEITAVAV